MAFVRESSGQILNNLRMYIFDMDEPVQAIPPLLQKILFVNSALPPIAIHNCCAISSSAFKQ